MRWVACPAALLYNARHAITKCYVARQGISFLSDRAAFGDARILAQAVDSIMFPRGRALVVRSVPGRGGESTTD
jgi:hypothetical protein